MEERPYKQAVQARLDALQHFVTRVAPGGAGSMSRLDAAAAEAVAELERSGVDALLLKGSGLGALLYGPGGDRSFSDVDLLVAPAQIVAAEHGLARLGYVDTGADKGIDDIGGVVHAHTWVRSSAGPPIDLHRWLPGSRADPAVAWEALLPRRTWIQVGGRSLPVLDRVGQAMHLATHAAQHGPAFDKHVSELELALALWPAEVWESAVMLAGEIGAVEPFAAGLRLSRRGTEVAAQLGLASTGGLDWTIRHLGERPRGTFHVQALAEAASARDRLDVLRRALFPPQAWIVEQHPWARQGGLRLLAAYGIHLARAPAWTARAARFYWHARRAARQTP
jgi:hypothetical protein